MEDRFSRSVMENNFSEPLLLMHKDTPILRFNIDLNVYEPLVPELLPYSLRGGFMAASPSDEQAKRDFIRDTNREIMLRYLSHRVLSLTRSNAKKMYDAYNIAQKDDVYSKARLAVACRAVSVEDCYWLKTEGTDIKWDDINLRKNSLSEVVANIMLHGKSLTLTGNTSTPEFTNNGSSAMAWKREDDSLYLHKRSHPGTRESETEVFTSRILDCFDVPHVRYEKASAKGEPYECRCRNMCSEDLERVTADEISIYCTRQKLNFNDFISSIDEENIAKMCVMDYLLSNSDRHSINWGFYQSSATGKLLCMHPMFDHNNAMDEALFGDACRDRKSQVYEGCTMEDLAERSIRKFPIKCIAPVMREMFPSDEAYADFMARACRLGLYRKHEKSFLEKIGLKKCEEYEPVSISIQEKDAYMDSLYKIVESEKSREEHSAEKRAVEPQELKNDTGRYQDPATVKSTNLGSADGEAGGDSESALMGQSNDDPEL